MMHLYRPTSLISAHEVIYSGDINVAFKDIFVAGMYTAM